MALTTKHKQQQPSGRRILRLRPAYLILLAVMALFAYKFVEKTREIHSLAGQEAALRWQNQQTAQENAQLQQALRYYRTPAYVEEQARAIFGDSKPGDMLVQSQPVIRPLVPAVRQAPARPPAPPVPTWQRWWRAFFGK